MRTGRASRAVQPPAASVGSSLGLAGVAALAITQPVLDLMGRNPEFFVAGRYTRSQIVTFAVMVALGPSLLLLVASALSRRLHRRLGTVVHDVLLAALGAVFGNVLLRGVGIDSGALSVVAALGGATLVVMLGRTHPGGLLLRYLAGANLFFLVAFLVASPSSALLSGGAGQGALGSVDVPLPPGPVVVVVFDELPVSTLMRSDGTINAERYPSFARLAGASTWFRNTSSPHHRTERAVPAVLTGTVLDERVMPTYDALPRNLLALMATAMPVRRYEAVTDLCPRSACERRSGQPLRQALEDSLVVFGHRFLPRAVREGLPPIDDAWGSFGASVGGVDAADAAFAEEDPLGRWHGAGGSERSPITQARRLVEQAAAIDGTPALHFVHAVLPHAPWFATPWGTRLMPPMPRWEDDEGQSGPLAAWSSLVRYQRHSLQTGAADAALGDLIDHLQRAGTWDRTTLLVTADHGTSTIPPDVMREPTAANRDEVYRVPFFLKAAAQRGAAVDDDVAMTIDVLPTLMDLLGIESDWRMDGHSLLDGSVATTRPLVGASTDDLFRVVRRHAADFPHGWDWTALAAVGDHGDLVGRRLSDLEIGAPSTLRWTSDHRSAFTAVPDETGEVPQLLTGTIHGATDDEPPALAIVVNGTVAGVTGGYARASDGWTFSSMLGPFLLSGANQVDVYEVAQDGDRTVLGVLR